MSPSGFHASKKMLLPLAYGCVDDALDVSFPDCNNAFRQLRIDKVTAKVWGHGFLEHGVVLTHFG